MKKAARILILSITALLPGRFKRLIYSKVLNAKIEKTAKIGISYIDVKNMKIGAYASIGHFNVIKGLEKFEIEEYTIIGSFNKITAVSLDNKTIFPAQKDRYPALLMAKHSAIVSKHFFDCNDTISIGKYTTIAGAGSMFWTHGINVNLNKQETSPVKIGDYCLIAARIVAVKGSSLPDNCIVATNSTLYKAYGEPYMLYSGVPAEPVKKLDPNAGYFHRENGRVD